MLKYASSEDGTTTFVTRPSGHVMRRTRTHRAAVTAA
jgi:hypothetical protein